MSDEETEAQVLSGCLKAIARTWQCKESDLGRQMSESTFLTTRPEDLT